MSNTKNQHYVPEVYLKKFANKGNKQHFTYRFDVKKMEPYRNSKANNMVTVDSQCHENYFYELKDKNDDTIDLNKYENLFYILEGAFGNTITSMENKKSDENLYSDIQCGCESLATDEELEIIKIYIMSQMLRHPDVINLAVDEVKKISSNNPHINIIKNEALKNCLNFLEHINDIKEIKTDGKASYDWTHLISKIDKTNIAYIIYQKWINNAEYVFVVSDNDCFFTSDFPLYIYKEEMLVFPLTSKIGLIIKCNNKRNSTTLFFNDLKLIKYINQIVVFSADENIYSKIDFSEEDIEMIKQARSKKVGE